jgi:hypothetical protein
MLALIGNDAGAGAPARKPVMIAPLAPAEGGARADIGPPGSPPGLETDARRGQLCQDLYARKVGELAFLETRLSLTGAQAPLFARWKQASLDVAKRHEGECSARVKHEPGQRRDLVQRLDLEETMLKQRLADIAAERPSLTALYAALSTEQKQAFGGAGPRGFGGHMDMMGGHRGMGPGPMGPMDHGPMGAMPPPPAPQ